ncbi:choline dehydrogenase [Ophiobolus disseminans]|uniref:Choline dehydrogenase n=1 Tax=Ophiobolus disseminans TaxID=1469910 RepID=A0A6A7AAK6_9PLEO|nr:choline dehydrogenase [Ophiobolus disseminans]
MWPFVPYPECSADDIDGKTYDYIVIGGGTAGCVLASRLSEDPTVSVLLIERGHVKNSLVSRMPLLSQNLFWTDTLQVQSTIWSEPIHGAYGRSNRLWAVNGVGGGSRLNAMLWTRGWPGNYNTWSNMGLEDWAWDKVEPYFRRLEHVTGPPDKIQSGARGHNGPIELRQPLYPFKWLIYLAKAASNLGISIMDDCNDPESPSCGYYPLETAISKSGERVSALTAYLSKHVAQERIKYLSVCTGTVAFRLQVTGDENIGRTVTGVHIRSSTGPKSGKDYLVRARREVILTCGAMTTPQLLLLSGIGPSGEDSTESRLGIPLVKELPAVGADFSDHYSIPIMLQLPAKETLHVLQNAIWGLWYILVWIVTGKGLMGFSSAPTAIFLHTDSIDEKTMQVTALNKQDATRMHQVPNIEIMMIPLNTLERTVPERSLFSIYPTLLQPRAKGRLEITSTDPLVNPKITHPMFGHKEDQKTARIAVRFSMRLAHEFQALYPFPAPFAFGPGNELQSLSEWEKLGAAQPIPVATTTIEPPRANKTWKDVTDDEIDDYMRRVGHTALHFSSTCPMGVDEKHGVVDQKLKVFGFTNLRIADASVLPKITSAHTMAPVLMIAERCADFIKSAWEEA